MILCLDVGNSHIYGGVFADGEIRLRFRRGSTQATSDDMGIFFRNVLRENKVDPDAIQHMAICSVVPALDYSLRSACIKYFDIEPFILHSNVKTGLKIKVAAPQEVGSDRIANAIAATSIFPDENLLLIDFGTATTVCAITKEKEFLGGAILPGIRLSMEALQLNTAKLPSVEIVRAEAATGKKTETNIQAGLYFGTLGAVRELSNRMITECFSGQKPTIVATGGFSHLFEHDNLFDHLLPDLVLQGIYKALQINL